LQGEFSWLLRKENIQALRKTDFVYGATQAVTERFHSQLVEEYPGDQERQLYLTNLFRNFETYVDPEFLDSQSVDAVRLRRMKQ
jgi:hypothetical protein